MFEKYNINELFLASIDVVYGEPHDRVDCGGVFTFETCGYGYWTIVRKCGDTYIDLQNPKVKLTFTKSAYGNVYIIDYMEPLSDYYTQDGKRKETFSRRQAIKEAAKHYDAIHQKRFALIKEQAAQRAQQN